MTAPARPQHYADAAAEHVAADRAAVTALVGSYRDTLARGLDPLTALACVAGAAYQEMCNRRATQVIAAAVQMLHERDTRKTDGCCDDHSNICGVVEYAHESCCEECPEFAKSQAGVDRHWGPLAATGGES